MWFLGLIVLQIIATADSQYWSGCSGVIFPPDEHVNCVSTDTATETSSETKMRCFCLHKPPSMNSQDQPDWAKSDKDCSKKYRGGRLAMDDREDVHRILTAMVITHCAEAWIGGKAVPWHWNWLPTLENKIKQQMSYQGCCVVPDNVDAVSRHNYTSTNNLQGNCNKKCSEHSTTYFTLQKKKAFWECACYEWNKIDPAQCERGLCQRCNNGWCGSTQQSKAVYLTAAKAYYNKWNWGQPTQGGNCLVFRMQWFSASCGATTGITDSVYCVKENPSTCGQHDAEWRGQETGKCFKSMQMHSRTHQASVEQCEKNSMSLVSVTSEQVQRDVEWLYDNDRDRTLGYIRTAGTNLRWRWLTGSDIYDGFTAWPNQREQFAFENMCLAITVSGLWNSSSCQTRKTYICETVVDGKNITFNSSALVPVITGIPSSVDPRTKAKVTEFHPSTLKPEPTSTVQTTRVFPVPDKRGKEAQQIDMTAVIAGTLSATLLVLLIAGLLLLRYKRQNRGQRKQDPSNALPTQNECNSSSQLGSQNGQLYNVAGNYELLQSKANRTYREYDALADVNVGAEPGYEALASKAIRVTTDYDALQNMTDKPEGKYEHFKGTFENYEKIKHATAVTSGNYEDLDRQKIEIPRNYEPLNWQTETAH